MTFLQPDGRSGSTRPAKRLAVQPRSARRAIGEVTARVRLPQTFPLSAPTWPGTIERPPPERTLGVDYDSSWARSPGARLGRRLVIDVVTRPAVAVVASPRIHGVDRIAHLDEPVIFAANHTSHVDAPLLVSTIPPRWRDELFVAGAADYFFDTKFKATVFSFLLNAVPIERQRVSRDSAARVTELLSDGWSMLIFPEGGRSPDGWGRPHRPGAAWLAVRTQRPIVPVHIEGTRKILAKGSTRIRRAATDVSFGAPLVPSEGEDPRSLSARLEASIAALADELATDWYSARRRAATQATPTLTGPDAGEWRRAWALTSPARDRVTKSREQRWPR